MNLLPGDRRFLGVILLARGQGVEKSLTSQKETGTFFALYMAKHF